jgi:RIO kinase 1
MKINEQLLDDIYWDEEEAYQYLPHIKGMTALPRSIVKENPPHRLKISGDDLLEQIDTLHEYHFTYQASRHEEWWLLDSLGPFFDGQWFDDVLQIVKGGKEASVYLCQGNPSSENRLLAAKVYRPRSLRNLRKDHIYREGRARLDADGLEIIDERQHRAIRNRTTYGQGLMHTSWIEHEFRTLCALHKAGCDVPAPLASDHNAILMEFIGDERMAAQTLNGIRLHKKEAHKLFEKVLNNINLMLDNQRVHGDLSAYNVLYFDGEITLIDFPQAINPNRNLNAYPIFLRDITRICEYFISQGVKTEPKTLAEDLWRSHGFSSEPNMLWDEHIDELTMDLF